MSSKTIYIATRGSALALAQANMVLAQCRQAAPDQRFEIRIIKTTGDKLQTASLAQEGHALPKGLFTKELETALLSGEAQLAVHSLKDLPTELPEGLILGAVGKREDVRDVLLCRGDAPFLKADSGCSIHDLPAGAAVATSSTRRKAQLLALNAQLRTPDIRGNVLTRMRKLAESTDLDATVLALAGMNRLNYRVTAEGRIEGGEVPEGLRAAVLGTDTMLPCVGQGAIGIEIRADDPVAREICERLNHFETAQCVTAERAFLAGMGGGCQSPVAALSVIANGELMLTAISFFGGPVRRATLRGRLDAPVELGQRMAVDLR